MSRTSPTARAAQRHQAPTPEITCFALGPFATNCYVVRVPPAPSCWIIDSSFQPEAMIEHVREQDLHPEAIILTHAHIDHIAGLDLVRRAFRTTRTGQSTPVYIHEEESGWLTDPVRNLSASHGELITVKPAERTLTGDETLTLSDTTWNVLHTPGHSPGGVTLVHLPSKIAIVGDTLFAGSIGRFDFPTSDEQVLYRSIRERLYELPDETVVHPGHGPTTTIGREKRSNPFVRAS